MGFRIEDGTGQSNEARVDSKNNLRTHSQSEPIIQSVSDIEKTAFSISSSYVATGGDEVLYFKNTHPNKHFHVEGLYVGSTVNSKWTLFVVTGGTAAGTTVTPVNMNTGSGNTAQATVFGDASVTGSLVGDSLVLYKTLAEDSDYINLQGAVLVDPNNEIALTVDAAGTVDVTLFGFYESEDE